jgi:hypothetical protein
MFMNVRESRFGIRSNNFHRNLLPITSAVSYFGEWHEYSHGIIKFNHHPLIIIVINYFPVNNVTKTA